jgi:Flp pilus assembly protein CpaB
MRHSPRVVVAWLAAVVVALTTARVVGGDLATLHRRAATLGPERRVVVAARDLATGEQITARDVTTEARYAKEIPREALTDEDAAIGRVVLVPVLRHALVFAAHLTPADRSGAEGVVAVGQRAVHVTPADGFRPPRGAIVDVLAAFDPTVVVVEGARTSAVIVASGARVLAVDERDDTIDDTTAGVTLLVTESEARVLAFAAANGDLTLAIAPPESALHSPA